MPEAAGPCDDPLELDPPDSVSVEARDPEDITHLRSASIETLEAEGEMLAERANALLRLGDPGAHNAAFRALVAARATADQAKTLDALGLVVVAEVRVGRLQEGLAAAEQGLHEVEGSGTMDEVDAVAAIAWVLSLLGDEPRCRAMIERAERGLADRRMTAPSGLVVNAEPCSMCASALVKAGLGALIYGAEHEPHMDPALGVAEVFARAAGPPKVQAGVRAAEAAAQIAASRAAASGPVVD